MRVLIIEDELQLARHLIRALYRSGHDAVAAHDGEAGLRAALEQTPEIIVLDSGAPDTPAASASPASLENSNTPPS